MLKRSLHLSSDGLYGLSFSRTENRYFPMTRMLSLWQLNHTLLAVPMTLQCVAES